MQRLQGARTSLLFTNTRSQAELWHQALAAVWPDDPATLALHHGSLDPKLRAAAEQGLRDGSVRCVVATSSLDLGVDFPAVDQVFQVGSPKGVARLLQRAGRARHRPGEAGHVICVPTHALELVEYAAARAAIGRGEIESRVPLRLSLDVLAQHCVTLALGGGFDADALFAEVRGTHAFAALDDATWQRRARLHRAGRPGAGALSGVLPRRRSARTVVYRVEDRTHRLPPSAVDRHHHQRRQRVDQDAARRPARLGRGRLHLAPAPRRSLPVRRPHAGTGAAGRHDRVRAPGEERQRHRAEMAGRPHAAVERTRPRDRARLRACPRHAGTARHRAAAGAAAARCRRCREPGVLLVEQVRRRGALHLFVYPFAGRAGARRTGGAAGAALGPPGAEHVFLRQQRLRLGAVAGAGRRAIDAATARDCCRRSICSTTSRPASMSRELARRQFREIARVAGLLPPSLPGRALRSMRQLQASSGLLFDVLTRFDPGHLLLAQAAREVLASQLEVTRLAATRWSECAGARAATCTRPRTLTPLSFPLWAETMRGQSSSEDWKTRVRRAAEQMEKRNAR